MATLADQSVVRGTLEQLQPEKPGPNDPELRFYPIKKPLTPALISGLQALAPTARITPDPGGKRLTVIATPGDQESIQKNLERFEQAAAAEGSERLLVLAQDGRPDGPCGHADEDVSTGGVDA